MVVNVDRVLVEKLSKVSEEIKEKAKESIRMLFSS